MKSILYGHLMRGSVRVKAGDMISKGTVIATLGNTGYSTGPHLHITVVPRPMTEHWYGYQTVQLGGTKQMITDFLAAGKIIKNSLGLRDYVITADWYGYADHGAIDLIGPDRTSQAGESQIVWNQDKPGRVAAVLDYGENRTGVTVIVHLDDAPLLSTDEVAKQVLADKWGTGSDRKNRLEAAGYNYAEVQARVNALLNSVSPKLSLIAIANEVLAGKWGDGAERKKRLTDAGYDYVAVQRKINEILTPVISVGDKVRVNVGAKTYEGLTLADFVYRSVYTVMELSKDRAVIGIDGRVTAAVDTKDLVRV